MSKENLKGVDYLQSTDTIAGVKDDQFIALRDEFDNANTSLKYYKDLINRHLLEYSPYQYLQNIGISNKIISEIKNELYHKCRIHNQNAINNIITPNDTYPVRSDFVDLSNNYYGRLHGIKWLGRDKTRRHSYYLCECECECGNQKICAGNLLVNGTIRSCGCLIMEANIVHSGRSSRLYIKWTSMHDRWYNPKTDSYYLYGKKGITVCDEWRRGCGVNGVHPFIAFRN